MSLTSLIEDVVIKLRQTRKFKLPDAIIAATAIHTDVELLTLDQHLLAVVNSFQRMILLLRQAKLIGRAPIRAPAIQVNTAFTWEWIAARKHGIRTPSQLFDPVPVFCLEP